MLFKRKNIQTHQKLETKYLLYQRKCSASCVIFPHQLMEEDQVAHEK
jgi:hypothetical protein